jgi:hypothetical protein
LTAEQLEAARAERLRQNGHGAIAFEDVRTWVEETGLCVYLPRPTQAGQIFSPATPSFVEAVAGRRTPEPTLELIKTAESLLVRLEADGVAVRLNLAGLPGEQPDYIVAAWVLPYIYALRGDRDWRRSPQLTGSRQVSPLAVQVAKHLEPANLTAAQLRDQLGREVTEGAVLRALHELWKQLRVIPVVPGVGAPALWQPLRQRFQKAIAEGASTSQVTAISVLASIYLQAVIAGSMEDVEQFLSPLTSRSKIREVLRGLAATRQVHTTAMGHASLYYVAGTLPDFPAVPSYISTPAASGYRSSYLPSFIDETPEEDFGGSGLSLAAEVAVPAHAVASGNGHHKTWETELDEQPVEASAVAAGIEIVALPASEPVAEPVHRMAAARPAKAQPAASVPAPRPRPVRSAATAHPRERSRSERGEARSGGRSGNGEWRRSPAPRATSGSGGPRSGASSRPARGSSESNGHHAGTPVRNGHSNGFSKNGNGAQQNGNGAQRNGNGAHRPASGTKAGAKSWGSQRTANGSRPAANGNGAKHGAENGNGRAAGHTASRNGSSVNSGAQHRPAGTHSGAKPAARSSNGHRPEARNGSVAGRSGARPVAGKSAKPTSAGRKPSASASKRYSFAGQAKQAPKPAAKTGAGRSVKGKSAAPASRGKSARPATTAKRRG